MAWLLGLVVLGVLAASWLLASRSGTTAKGQMQEGELYRKLLRKTLGDQAQAERLIVLERGKRPKLNRRYWIQAALENWERHNR